MWTLIWEGILLLLLSLSQASGANNNHMFLKHRRRFPSYFVSQTSAGIGAFRIILIGLPCTMRTVSGTACWR